MKKLMFLLVLSLWTVSAFAQDVIVKRDATKIEAVIVEVSDNEIRYKNYSNQSGPTFVIKTDDIASVIYKNGEVQVFERKVEQSPAQQNARGGGNPTGKLSYIGGYYYLDGQVMSKDELGYFLMDKCLPAYQHYKRFSDLGYSGVAFLSIGGALVLSGGIVFAVHDSYAGFCTMMAGVASVGAGIPLCTAGFVCRNNACHIYNSRCAKTAFNRSRGLQLNLQSSRDGIGLALRF